MTRERRDVREGASEGSKGHPMEPGRGLREDERTRPGTNETIIFESVVETHVGDGQNRISAVDDRGRSGQGSPQGGTSPTEAKDQTRDSTRDRIERVAAAISGAAEGLVEGLERYKLVEETEEALHQAGETVRRTTDEASHQLQTPEARQLTQSARRAGSRIPVAVRRVGDGTTHVGSTKENLVGRGEEMQERLTERVEHGKERALEGIHNLEERAERARTVVLERTEQVRDKAHAVQEVSRRSSGAMSSVLVKVKDAASATVRSSATMVGGYAAAGVIGTITLVLLSIGSVVAFNMWLGAPWGLFITAGIFALAAAAVITGAKAGSERQQKEADRHLESARHTIEYVTAPLKESGMTSRDDPKGFEPKQVHGGPTGKGMTPPVTRNPDAPANRHLSADRVRQHNAQRLVRENSAVRGRS